MWTGTKGYSMKMNGHGVRRSRLTYEEIAAIADYGAKAVWPAGFQIYQRGTAADGAFIVLEGHVVLRNKIKVGRGFVPVIATAGQTFGSEGLSVNAHYVTDANAAEETRTMFLSGQQFRAFVRERPVHTIPLLSQIMSERAFLLEKLHELAALNVDQRLISTLSHLSSDRTFTAPDGRLKLENNHHRLLCEMVGATRESIALALSRLVSAGIAERKGMTFLIEPNSLTNTLGDYTTQEVAIPVARQMTAS
jgi:CRP/FNR family transcriptional regulator